MSVPLWKQRRAKSLQASIVNGTNIVLTARMFLGKDGHAPYLIPELLINFGYNAREHDVEHFSNVIEMSKHLVMTGCRASKMPDRGGNHYMWVAFSRNGNTDGGKVPNIGNLYQFAKDLYDRKFTVGFTFDELLEEAEQA